jgi:hypothetical protein
VAEVIDSFNLAIEGPVSGLEDADISFTADASRTLTVNFGDTFFDAGGEARIRINTVPVAAVPVPGALALLGIGLIGLGFSRRRTA